MKIPKLDLEGDQPSAGVLGPPDRRLIRGLWKIFLDTSVCLDKTSRKMAFAEMASKEKSGCLIRIRSRYPRLTDSEKRVADFLLSSEDFIYRTITQVAREGAVSYGSISRFCKKMGYSGFQDLKIHLAEDLARRKISRQESASHNGLFRLAESAIQDIHNAVQLLCQEEVDRAADTLISANFVLVAGLSSSAATAMGIEYRLGRFGFCSCCSVDNHIQRHRAATLKPEDVAFLISFSGSTREILATARIAGNTGATVIALTNYLESPLSELSDITLVTGIERDPLSAEIASKVAVEFVVSVLFEQIANRLPDSRALLSRTFQATADRQL